MGGARVKSVQLAAVAGLTICEVPVQQISLVVAPPCSTKKEPAPPVTLLSFRFRVTRTHSNGAGALVPWSAVRLSILLAQAAGGSPFASHAIAAVGGWLYSLHNSASIAATVAAVVIPGRVRYRILLLTPGKTAGACATRSPLPALPE